MASITGSEKKTYNISLSGTSYTFSLTRRIYQKNINIRIGHGGELSVSAPKSVTLKRIREVLLHKERWITRHLHRVRNERERIDPLHTIFLSGESVTILIRKAEKRASVIYNGRKRTITLKTLSQKKEDILMLLGNWLQRYARPILLERVQQLSVTTGIPYNKVFIRNQKTRWGSSSGKGNISLNWRIIMAPPFVQDYLIIHELLHQHHRNHQHTFWNAVEKVFPQWREADTWIKENRLLLGLFR
jgi:hypothetical protein